MIQPCATISLIPEARGGPFLFWDDLASACEKAAALGFSAVEIFAPSPDSLDTGKIRQLLESHGLKLAALGSGGGWILHQWHLAHEDSGVRVHAREFIGQMIERAAELGAPVIIGSMQGRHGGGVTRAMAVGWLSEALEDLGNRARIHKQILLYEPLNRYETNLFNRAADVVELLQSLRTDNVKVLADLFHMNIEEVSLESALRTYGVRLGHLHFVDSNRRPAGCGHIDFSAVARVLLEMGYSGYASAEALPYPSSDEAASLSMKAFRQYFGPHPR